MLTDNDTISFGKYKGKKLIDIPADYFLFLHSNKSASQDILDYIEDNLDALKEESKDSKKHGYFDPFGN